jgi:hypothetical protein
MSYSLSPYQVDLDALRRAVGSRDESLLAVMVADDPRLAEPEKAGRTRREIPLGRALRHLVMGEPAVEGSAHQYGYALEALCKHLGGSLPSAEWAGVSWFALEATGLDGLMTGAGPPVTLPPIEDFPAIGHLGADEVAERAASPARDRPGGVDPEYLPLIDEFQGWLRTAASGRNGLVFFYY